MARGDSDDTAPRAGRPPRPPEGDGIGKWSPAALRQRHAAYAARFREPQNTPPFEPPAFLAGFADRPWIMPLIERVIAGIARGERACLEIGVELIEEDAKFAFGKILKANTANALRRADLDERLKARVRTRIVDLLERGLAPHEMRQYARLVKRIGLGAEAERLQRLHAVLTAAPDPADRYVLRFVRYLLDPDCGPRNRHDR